MYFEMAAICGGVRALCSGRPIGQKLNLLMSFFFFSPILSCHHRARTSYVLRSCSYGIDGESWRDFQMIRTDDFIIPVMAVISRLAHTD